MRTIIAIFFIQLLFIGSTLAQSQKNLTVGDFYIQYFDKVSVGIPASYQYIDAQYIGIPKSNNRLFEAIQKGIYLGSIPNKSIALPRNKPITSSVVDYQLRHDFDLTFDFMPGEILTLEKWTAIYQKIPSILSHKYGIDTNIGGFISDSVGGEIYDQKIGVFNAVLSTLQNDHVDKDTFTQGLLLNGAIKGLTDSIGDPYTKYFTSDEFDQELSTIEGSYVGIGVYLGYDVGGILTIQGIVPGGPAEKGGLIVGDQIILIDGNPVYASDRSLSTVTQQILGPRYTKVLLTIQRKNTTIDVSLVRDIVSLQNISTEILDNETLYIDITLFSTNIYQELIKQIKQQNLSTISKVIIDVRDNPGGVLEEVENILSLFVPIQSPIVTFRGAENTTFYTRIKSQFPELATKKIVILVNEGSASASEILTLGLKEYIKDVTIVGTQTYGKGTVQKLISYADGSVLKYTSSAWCSGKGKVCINTIGITPDMQIEQDFSDTSDNILDFARSL